MPVSIELACTTEYYGWASISRLLALVFLEIERDTIDAVTAASAGFASSASLHLPLVCGSVETLAFEHMSQVRIAIGTTNLYSATEHRVVLSASDGTRDGVIECWPAAARLTDR